MQTPKDWTIEEQKLTRVITLGNFSEVISLVNNIAKVSESLNHHPDLEIYNYKNLKIKISTHDTNSLTDKDYKLSTEIDKLV